MKKFSIITGVAAMTAATAAGAHDTATAYPTRGACESASAHLSNAEQDWLLATFPDVFSSPGEASSFLTRAWTCDRAAGGQYYIVDHIQKVLDSDWFEQRNH